MSVVTERLNYRTTEKAELWSDEEDFCWLVFSPEAEVDLADAQQIMKSAGLTFTGEKYVTLVDARSIKSISSEAREYFVDEESGAMLEAVAILVGSTHSRLLANFFINFHKPTVPTRMFTDIEKAKTWLREFMPNQH